MIITCFLQLIGKSIRREIMEKTFFIQNYLSNLLRALDSNISSCRYLIGKSKNEYCVVCYKNESSILIDITADSNAAIVTDVIKALFF